MGEFSQVTTACLLKVCDQHIAVFHTALQMIERNNEFHVVDLSNCDDVQCKVHQFQISHLFADHFRGVNLHVPILLILGRLLQHADHLSEILFTENDNKTGILCAQVSLHIDDLPIENGVSWFVKVLEEVHKVTCYFERALSDQCNCAHFFAVLKL